MNPSVGLLKETYTFQRRPADGSTIPQRYGPLASL